MKLKNRLKNYLLSRTEIFLPSWIILLKDLLILIFSFATSYTLRYNFQVPVEVVERMYLQFIPLTIVAHIIFIITGIHKSVIRHTGLRDMILVVKANFFITLILLITHIIHTYRSDIDIINLPRAVIIIFFVLNTTIIIFTRSAIRLLYYWLNTGVKVNRVLIYGAGSAGIITKNALTADQAKPTKVVGFIDNNPGKIGKTIEGIKVYSHRILKTNFIKENQITEVIFSIQKIDRDRKRKLIEDLLHQTQLQVKEVPPVDSWINGELSARQIAAVKITDLLQRNEIVLDTKHVCNHIEGNRVMVTGAAGSIGSELVRQIIKFKPSNLILLDQGETPMFNLENELNKTLPSGITVEYIIGDVSNHTLMERVFSKYTPHILYHAAAYKHVPMMERNPFEAVRVNIIGTKNLADLAVKYKVARFVMISTDKAVNPTNVMGATKRAAEIYIQSLNNHLHSILHLSGTVTEFITTRFGNVLGSNGSVIPLFEKQISAGGPVTVTHPEITRYFMTIPEACRLVLEAGSLGRGGEILMFDMGEPVKIVDLAYNMIRLSGLEPDKDIRIVFTGLRPGEKLYEELLYDKEKGYSTHHPKIFVGKQSPYSYEHVLKNFSMLEEMVNNVYPSIHRFNSHPGIMVEENMNLISLLKQFIPEFISNNSIYRELDTRA